ncbi:CLUMA_CG019010, isoform A, partial [Clunio marinus]
FSIFLSSSEDVLLLLKIKIIKKNIKMLAEFTVNIQPMSFPCGFILNFNQMKGNS